MATADTPKPPVAGLTGRVEPAEEEKVTPLELFFDLVFVLSFTQVTAAMAENPTWTGVGEGMLIIAAVWWAWVAYAWLTNEVDPNENLNRLAVFAAMAAMLIVSLTVPEAFGDEGILFGCAFFVVRALQVLLFVRAGRDVEGDELLAGVLRMAPAWLAGSALIIVAGFFDDAARAAIWVAALIIDYGLTLLVSPEGYRVSPSHFAERFGLIIIIALGESVVAIGAGVGIGLSSEEVIAAIVAILLVAAMWWAYFDIVAIIAERRLTEASGLERARLARESYSFLHLPMIVGIVLVALGVKKTLGDVDEPLKTVPAVALFGGVALYMLAHIAFRLRNVRTIAARRAAIAAVCVALIPVATEIDALAALAMITGIYGALNLYEAIRFREGRARVYAHPTASLDYLRGRSPTP